MDNLIFSLNAMMPLFLLMVTGMVLRRFGVVSEPVANGMNKFVFVIGIPVLLFHDLATTDISKAWDPGFILFCFAGTVGGIAVAFLFSLLFRGRSYQGEFVQAAYRSSASMIAIGVMQNIYGTSGMAPLMVIGAVPLYNIMAVVILVFMRPRGEARGGADASSGADTSSATGACATAGGRAAAGASAAVPEKAASSADSLVFTTLRDVVTNPIIIGIVSGLAWAVIGLPMPTILDKTLESISDAVTPVGFIAMGVLFDARRALAVRGPAFLATALKLVGLAAVTLPPAVALGFRGQELVAVLVMAGSATTLSSFVMARNMGHDGTLTSSVVMLSTLLSAFTLTGWLWLLKELALI